MLYTTTRVARVEPCLLVPTAVVYFTYCTRVRNVKSVPLSREGRGGARRQPMGFRGEQREGRAEEGTDADGQSKGRFSRCDLPTKGGSRDRAAGADWDGLVGPPDLPPSDGGAPLDAGKYAGGIIISSKVPQH
jgi:hypothetical protein